MRKRATFRPLRARSSVAYEDTPAVNGATRSTPLRRPVHAELNGPQRRSCRVEFGGSLVSAAVALTGSDSPGRRGCLATSPKGSCPPGPRIVTRNNGTCGRFGRAWRGPVKALEATLTVSRYCRLQIRFRGGAGGIRTLYLNTASVALSRLSYSPGSTSRWYQPPHLRAKPSGISVWPG